MRNSIRSRRLRRKIKRDFELQLTSMMDMLIILLVFLLKSYSTNAVAFATSSSIKLPVSTAEETPTDATNLIIESNAIILDQEKILEFKPNTSYEIEPNLLSDNGKKIMPLYDSLIKNKEKAELLMSKVVWKDPKGSANGSNDKPKFHGTLIIHADKAVRYETLRKMMYTAGAAQYKTFKLVTTKKEI